MSNLDSIDSLYLVLLQRKHELDKQSTVLTGGARFHESEYVVSKTRLKEARLAKAYGNPDPLNDLVNDYINFIEKETEFTQIESTPLK